MTLTTFLVICGVLFLLGRVYWVSSVLDEEYETFCMAVDHYHTRHNAVARMATMRGKKFTEWPAMPAFESYSKTFVASVVDPRVWSRKHIVNRRYMDEFEADLNRVKDLYYF